MSGNGADLAGRLAILHAEAFDVAWSAAELAALLAMPGASVAEEPDGFILWRQAADEAEIITLAVRPSARRRGMGGRLLDAAIVQARPGGVRRIFLEVAEDNAAAVALYASRGFQDVGRRPAYYSRSDGGRADAMILALNLF